MTELYKYGFNEYFINDFKQYEALGYEPARIISEHKEIYRIISRYGEMNAEISGKFRFNAAGVGDFPAVGDWVACDLRIKEESATIHKILQRKSKFSRKAAGLRTDEQVVAANFSYVFIMTSLNYDLNLRRLERYITASWESGANPVIILTKADLCEEISSVKSLVESVAYGIPIHTISARTGEGMDGLSQYLKEGNTIVFLGSSGVGKSTLLNRLAGEEIMKVKDVREDDSKGRHATTHRQLIYLPSGVMIIDTPGMRELTLWEGEKSMDTTFCDIEELSGFCKFSDCTHKNEPGCAVTEAIRKGEIDLARLESYRKLQKELKYIEGKKDGSYELARKEWGKSISKRIKSIKKVR